MMTALLTRSPTRNPYTITAFFAAVLMLNSVAFFVWGNDHPRKADFLQV